MARKSVQGTLLHHPEKHNLRLGSATFLGGDDVSALLFSDEADAGGRSGVCTRLPSYTQSQCWWFTSICRRGHSRHAYHAQSAARAASPSTATRPFTASMLDRRPKAGAFVVIEPVALGAPALRRRICNGARSIVARSIMTIAQRRVGLIRW